MAEKPPPALKPVNPYLMIAKQFQQRDPILTYYAKMYAVQEGIKIAKGDPVAKAYILKTMDELDQLKHQLKGEEAITSEVVAQAHVEETALKMFDFADREDRQGNFQKSLIRAFYSASHLFMLLQQFGELSEEVESKMKYAKWKAVEIDRCLKNGITPTPGPPGGDEGDEFGAFGGYGGSVQPDVQPPQLGFNIQPPEEEPRVPPGAQQVLPRPVPRPRQNLPQDTPQEPYPPSQPSYPPTSSYPPVPPPQAASYQPTPPAASYQPTPQAVPVGPAQIAKAQKHCKFASSSLDYDDVPGAIDFLEKAIRLLKTGKE